MKTNKNPLSYGAIAVLFSVAAAAFLLSVAIKKQYFARVFSAISNTYSATSSAIVTVFAALVKAANTVVDTTTSTVEQLWLSILNALTFLNHQSLFRREQEAPPSSPSSDVVPLSESATTVAEAPTISKKPEKAKNLKSEASAATAASSSNSTSAVATSTQRAAPASSTTKPDMLTIPEFALANKASTFLHIYHQSLLNEFKMFQTASKWRNKISSCVRKSLSCMILCLGANNELDSKRVLEQWQSLERKLNRQIYATLTFFLPKMMELACETEEVSTFDSLNSCISQYQTVDASSTFSYSALDMYKTK